jgi:hypothetical protein
MQEYYQNFYKTLVLNVATICAIVVAVVTFAIKAFNDNNGAEVLRKFTIIVLDKIDLLVIKLMDKIDTDVPDVEVAQ